MLTARSRGHVTGLNNHKRKMLSIKKKQIKRLGIIGNDVRPGQAALTNQAISV